MARGRQVLAVFAVLWLVAAVYAPVLEGVFVWDDHALVETNVRMQKGSVAQFFVERFWSIDPMTDGRPAYYRPLTVLSLRADVERGGLDPAGFHKTNLALHLLATVALVLAAMRLGASGFPSVVAAGLWALLPRSSESVAWVSGRTDLLAGLMSFAALSLWPWFRGSPDRHEGLLCDVARSRDHWRAFAASLALLLGLMAKEVAIAAAVALALGTVLASDEPSWPRRVRAAVPRLAWVFVPVVVYWVLRGNALRGATTEPASLGSLARAATVLEAVGRYVEMSLDAWHPASSIGLVGAVDRGRAALGFVVFLLAAAAVARLIIRASRSSRRDGPWAGLVVSLVFGAAALAPVIHLVPLDLASAVAADRLLYLPMGGLAMAGAIASIRLRDTPRHMACAFAGVLALSFALVTHARALDYTNELQFRLVAAEHAHAQNTAPKSGLANAVRAASQFDLACRLHASVRRELERTGRQGRARHVRALENLGSCFSVLGDYANAAALYRDLLVLRPDSARVHMELGFLALHTLELDGAEASLKYAIVLDPNLEPARAALQTVARARLTLGHLATPEARQALPKEWAIALGDVGRRLDAIAAWDEFLANRHFTDRDAEDAVLFLLDNAEATTLARAVDTIDRRGNKISTLLRAKLDARLRELARFETLRGRIESLVTD